MAICKTCGKSYHWCSSCQLDYHWEPDFCSDSCYQAYLRKDPKLAPIKQILFKLTNDELDTLDNLDGDELADLIQFCMFNRPEENKG